MPLKLLGVFGGKDFRYQYPNGHQVEYNIFMFDCVIKSGELSPIDNETAELKYFRPSNMPELALPYPKDLFLHRENSELYFQWNEQWLEIFLKNNSFWLNKRGCKSRRKGRRGEPICNGAVLFKKIIYSDCINILIMV